MAKKKQYYMESINGDRYYTTNQKLYEKSLRQEKWQNICTNSIMFCVLSFLVAMAAVAPQQHFNGKCVVAWVITAAFGLMCIAFIILGLIADKKIIKYEWQKEFEKSKEFSRQVAKYRKIEKAKEDKIKTKKATKLVESYEILDSKELSKQEKVDLIKKYIDIKEK